MDRPVGEADSGDTHRFRAARAWLLLFVFALVLRAVFAALDPPALDGDQRLYTILAESMARGDGYVLEGAPKTTVHPLLPTLHALLIRTGASPGASSGMLTVLIGALLPIIGGLAVGSVLGRRYGLVAGILLAVQPHYVLHSARLEPDLLAALLGFWAAWALWRGRIAVAGAVLGLAYLNRPEAIFLLVPASWIAWRRGAGSAGLFRLVAPCLGLAAVFLLFVHGATGRWALSGKDHWQYMLGVHQYRSGNQPLDPAEIPELRASVPSVVEHLRSHPLEALLGYVYRWGLMLRGLLRQGLIVLAPLGVVGIAHAWRRSRDGLALLCLPLFLLPVYPAIGVFFRHTLVVGPVLLALSGVGLVAVLDRWRPPPKLVRAGGYAVYLAIVGLLGLVGMESGLRAVYGNVREPLDPGPYRREAEDWPALPPEFTVERIRQPGSRFTATYTLYGCRHPGSLDAVQLEQGDIETVFLGDSFTFGWGVEDGETFGAVFAERAGTLRRTLVCGGYGRGTAYHVDQLRRVLSSEPHVERVVLQLFGNDLTQDLDPAGGSAGADPGGIDSMVRRIAPLSTAYVLGPVARSARRWTGPSSLDEKVRTLLRDYGPVLREAVLPPELKRRRDELFERFARRLEEIVALARARGAKVIVVVMPYAFRFEEEEASRLEIAGLYDDASYRRYLDRVRDAVEAAGAEPIDLEPYFRAAHDGFPETALFLPGDLHLTVEGNRVVADALFRTLERDGEPPGLPLATLPTPSRGPRCGRTRS